MDEFQLIRHYFAGLTAEQSGVLLGIGDDAALLQLPPGEALVVTTDTLVAGRHFPEQTAAFNVGWKALAVNLSDLAAMGARPRWFTLALTLPESNADWLAGFSEGLKALADLHGVALVGGDTTQGPLSIGITAMGAVAAGDAMRRDGAVEGDWICVTGSLGDAALGLQQLMRVDADPVLRRRLDRPTPRVEAGCLLAQWSRAAVDVSDGLAADLHHILLASELGGELQASQLPQSAAFAQAAPENALTLQLHGGDDYELCVCLPGGDFQAAYQALAAIGVPLTRVGVITAEPGLRLRQGQQVERLEPQGYQHFSNV